MPVADGGLGLEHHGGYFGYPPVGAARANLIETKLHSSITPEERCQQNVSQL